MASIAQSLNAPARHLTWFRQWLRDELTPYPGRALLVARMVLAAALIMIISMTFRIPFGGYSALFALTLSRESLEETKRAVWMIVIGFALAGAYVLATGMVVVGNPMVRFLWVAATLFLIFYAISATNNYGAAVRFGYLAVIAIPLWDRQIAGQDKVTGTLWLAGTLTIASVISLLLEMGYAALRGGNDLIDPILERIACVEQLLRSHAGGVPLDEATQSALTRFAMLGTSRLRRLLRRSNEGPQYVQEMGALVAMVGRLVDLAANLTFFAGHISDADRARIGEVADRIGRIRRDLADNSVPRATEPGGQTQAWPFLPLFGEIEQTVSLIPEIFSGSRSLTIFEPPPAGGRPVLAPGALFRPEHLKFGLRGCLAASLSYILYNALFWPEISTAMTTCFITALSTIGASHQKQVLRFGGALIGGFVIGIGAQVFILPYIDSIAGFTVLFVPVAAFAAWIITASPRLSYLGTQVAFAFFLINLQEFTIQTSLAVARDRVVGIFLGLLMMWLVFDRLWSAPAGVEMKKTLAANLRLLAQLAREPVSRDLRTAIERSYSLRETINNQFDKARSLADSVLFEFGPSRRRDLQLRGLIRGCQPQLRTLFVLRIAALKYRLQLRGFELPESVRLRHQAYDDHSARMLDELADRIECNAPYAGNSIEKSHELLDRAMEEIEREEPAQLPPGRAESFIALVRRIDALTTDLASEMAPEFG
jgi:multidrug resistance protein MdtO